MFRRTRLKYMYLGM